MSTTISNDCVRFKVDLNVKDSLLDVLETKAPTVWKGADWLFQFGLKYGAAWASVAAYTSVTLQVKTSFNGTVLISETVAAFDDTCTEEDFDAGTKQHFAVEVDRTKTGLDLSSAELKTFHLVVFATLANGDKFPLGTAQLTVKDSGMEVAPSPPAGSPDYYTAAQVDAKFVNNGIIYNGKFYKLTVDLIGGDTTKPVIGLAAGVNV